MNAEDPPGRGAGADQDLPAIVAALRERGFVFLSAAEAGRSLGVDPEALGRLEPEWDRLPRDAYLRDGGRYRSRRHTCLIQRFDGADTCLEQVPHRAHWQPTAYNALHGGLERWFEPIVPAVLGAAAWRALVASLGGLFHAVRAVDRWFIEAHQFRIDTHSGIGRPTPEGAHRDGVDFVVLVLVARQHIKGGETRVFDAEGSTGVRFVMREPWSLLLLDDHRVIHETTPIQPDGGLGTRDTLVLTYREHGFQAPGSTVPVQGHGLL